MGLKHLFESTAPPAPNPALVDGPNWNDDHYFLTAGHAALGALGDLPYRGTGGLVTLLAGAAGVLQSAGSGSIPAYTLDPTLTSLTVTGAITAGSIVITGGGGTISGPELGVLDGVTPGVVTASKAVVVDANKDIQTFRNLTASGVITTPLVNGTTTLGLQTAGVTRWSITAAGHLVAGVDNTYDIGASGATRPRRIFVGTEIAIGPTPASFGAVRIPYNTVVAARNAGSTGDVSMLGLSGADVVYVGQPANAIRLDGSSISAPNAAGFSIGVNPSTVGQIRLPNASGIYARNAANTADIALMTVNPSNEIVIGGAAAATLYVSSPMYPIATNTYNLGAGAVQWAQVYGAKFGSSTLTGTLVTNDPQTVPDVGVISLGTDAVIGVVAVHEHGGTCGLFFLHGIQHQVQLIAGFAGFYSVTAGTAVSINVYWSAANNRYELENRRTASRQIRVVRLGI